MLGMTGQGRMGLMSKFHSLAKRDVCHSTSRQQKDSFPREISSIMDIDYDTYHTVAPYTFVVHAACVVYRDIATLSSVDLIECSILNGIRGNQGNQMANICIFSDESMMNVHTTGNVKAGAGRDEQSLDMLPESGLFGHTCVSLASCCSPCCW